MSVRARIPHSPEPCLLSYKIFEQFRTVFEKGHPWNISVKLFQNLSSGFREDFLLFTNFFMSVYYTANSPQSPEPCFLTDQTFESGPHSPEPCLLTDRNFANRF